MLLRNADPMISIIPDRDDLLKVMALAPPLIVRFYEENSEAAVHRLLLLFLAIAVAYAWAILFALSNRRPLSPGLLVFATLFVVLLPGPVPWGGAVFALSFGAVFGSEIFAGRPILSPALISLAFAVFSFPEAGFETRGILSQSPDLLFAMSCLPGAAILVFRGILSWQIAAGAMVGLAAAGLLNGEPGWWHHASLGSFAGVLFLAAPTEGAPRRKSAQILHGIVVGVLIFVIRHADPAEPDGVVFAALLGGLFAPLVDRALGWRPVRG